jgi:hypothetical protein
MKELKLIAAAVACLAAGVAVAAGGGAGNSNARPVTGDPNRGLPQGSEPSTLNPADFTTEIDNPTGR